MSITIQLESILEQYNNNRSRDAHRLKRLQPLQQMFYTALNRSSAAIFSAINLAQLQRSKHAAPKIETVYPC